ncbi:glycosyltransferase [Paenalcaligenes hominis]|uniref:glycosyltransferase n=1 Tax=Paenalcaligenes hominis TaxID=643674 RepID=UPI003525A20E
MKDKPLIVFVSAVYPSQYTLLCRHLREMDVAETWFFTTPGHVKRHAHEDDYLRAFQPDGPIVGQIGYYYSSKVERSARIGRGLIKALHQFEKEQGRPIDIVVSHSLWGAPNWLYSELHAAVVSYIEFPSYRTHGWDPAYPPDPAQRMGDRNTEMLNMHQVLCSDLTITPSAFARSMFPEALQDRVAVQFEGFTISPPAAITAPPPDRPFTVAFSARDLSSSKGLETFVRLVDRLVREGDAKAMRFLALGDPSASTYGYEQQWVQRKYQHEPEDSPTKVKTFLDHLLRVYPAAAGVIEAPGKLPYEAFGAAISEVDLFLYPLKYGVANWGLMEILARGSCVIGSNWGFVPELITNDVNGVLLPDDDDQWIASIRELKNDTDRRIRYRKAAAELGQSYHISQVAPLYMKLFERALAQKKQRLAENRLW